MPKNIIIPFYKVRHPSLEDPRIREGREKVERVLKYLESCCVYSAALGVVDLKNYYYQGYTYLRHFTHIKNLNVANTPRPCPTCSRICKAWVAVKNARDAYMRASMMNHDRQLKKFFEQVVYCELTDPKYYALISGIRRNHAESFGS